MPLFLIILIVALVVCVWVVGQYNFFVSTKTRIKASVQEIGNQLKRQADLIPNLEESTKGYLKHEKGIFKDLTDARKQVASAIESGNVDEMAKAGQKLSQILPAIKVAVESNPEIKGSEVVVRLMDELRDTTDKVMYARRLLIDLTADYNVAYVTFPSNLVAQIFGLKEQEGLVTPEEGEHTKVSSTDLKTPKVKL